MTISWEDMIGIITATFKIRQKDIAQQLLVQESKISKIKAGKQSASDLLMREEIREKIFHSEKLSDETPKDRLNTLKETIEALYPNVKTAMKDYWDEKDYEKFVRRLLSKTRTALQPKDSVNQTSDMEQEKEPLNETPSEKMSRIFEQAAATHNIPYYICNLEEHLIKGLLYSRETTEFLNTMQTQVLYPFLAEQNENVYKLIQEFNTEIDNYFRLFSMLPLEPQTDAYQEKSPSILSDFFCDPNEFCYRSLAKPNFEQDSEHEFKVEIDIERLSFTWRNSHSYDEIFEQIHCERSRLEEELKKETHISELEEALIRLEVISSIFSAHKRVCELFGEITGGKMLLIH